MPDVDGIQAARNIRRAKPVPIVLITSHYDATTVERATKSGAMGYLIKPLLKLLRATEPSAEQRRSLHNAVERFFLTIVGVPGSDFLSNLQQSF